MKAITVIMKKTTIAEAIVMKGVRVGAIIDELLCNGEKTCCPGTTLTVGFAAKIKGKEKKLPKLLEKLNSLPDIR